MNNELKKILDQAKALWTKLPAGARMLVVLLVLGSVAGSAALGLRGPTESWAVLFSGMTAEDAAKVMEQLKADNTPYRIATESTIEVPAARVHELRLSLAAAGLPRGGGVGFEIFDKQSFGTTSFVEQMNYRRALQGELARTIMSLEAVDRARVHVAAPERSIYKDDDTSPSASVVLTLKRGRKLSPAQVRGVVHLVAASLPGLQPDKVTVVDESGTPLWSGEDAGGGGLEASTELERTLARKVRDILERVVGPGHAQVAVTAEIDESRAERTEDSYDKDKTALRSESRTEERTDSGNSTAGGVAGARGNLPGAPSPSTGSSSDGRMRTSETRNFEVNHVINHVVQPKARLKRLHVAVLVDQASDKKGGFVPRSADEMKRLSGLARAAAGLNDERGDQLEITSAAFAEASEPEAEKATLSPFAKLPKWSPFAVAGGVVLLMFIAVLALRTKKQPISPEIVRSLPAPVQSVEATLARTPALAAVTSHELSPAHASRDRALSAARGDATRAARVLSSWLADAPKNEVDS
jgi:flagellar M-ring protein FliF